MQCVNFIFEAPQIRFRMMQLYKLENKKHFRKDIPLSFVTHWNYSGCWAVSMPLSHLFYLLPSQARMSTRGGREINTIQCDFYFLVSPFSLSCFGVGRKEEDYEQNYNRCPRILWGKHFSCKLYFQVSFYWNYLTACPHEGPGLGWICVQCREVCTCQIWQWNAKIHLQ